MTEGVEIEGFVDSTGRKGDCPVLIIVLEPQGNEGIAAFTWTIGERATVIRDD